MGTGCWDALSTAMGTCRPAGGEGRPAEGTGGPARAGVCAWERTDGADHES